MTLPPGAAQVGFLFCLSLWLGWLGLLSWERRRHQRRLAGLRLRVHVNGTRGKSGVTRLIAAGLRGGGYRPFAKVTGTAAKWIEPDGTERPIPRRGLPNIRELIETVRQATRSQADALVCECMALQPELQEFCERRLIRSHIGVITNVRHDHEEVMGPDLPAIAASLARTAPQGGALVVTPETAALLPKSATDACRLRIVDPASVSAQELAGFAFAVEAENVALALAVCELAGASRAVALEAMQASQPDVGNLAVRELPLPRGGKLRFVDALAANDPDSTEILWRRYVDGAADAVLLHARADRRLRTEKLCERLVVLHQGVFYLSGDSGFAAACLRRLGVDDERLVRLDEATLAAVTEQVRRRIPAAQTDGEVTLFAAGNRKGFVV